MPSAIPTPRHYFATINSRTPTHIEWLFSHFVGTFGIVETILAHNLKEETELEAIHLWPWAKWTFLLLCFSCLDLLPFSWDEINFTFLFSGISLYSRSTTLIIQLRKFLIWSFHWRIEDPSYWILHYPIFLLLHASATICIDETGYWWKGLMQDGTKI